MDINKSWICVQCEQIFEKTNVIVCPHCTSKVVLPLWKLIKKNKKEEEK